VASGHVHLQGVGRQPSSSSLCCQRQKEGIGYCWLVQLCMHLYMRHSAASGKGGGRFLYECMACFGCVVLLVGECVGALHRLGVHAPHMHCAYECNCLTHPMPLWVGCSYVQIWSGEATSKRDKAFKVRVCSHRDVVCWQCVMPWCGA
jgi:hypothetical protein